MARPDKRKLFCDKGDEWLPPSTSNALSILAHRLVKVRQPKGLFCVDWFCQEFCVIRVRYVFNEHIRDKVVCDAQGNAGVASRVKLNGGFAKRAEADLLSATRFLMEHQ